MNYLELLPDELIIYISLYIDYYSLKKILLVNKNFNNHYNTHKEFIHISIIKNLGYKINECNESFNLQTNNYTLSITKNCSTNYDKLCYYLHNI